MQGISIATEFAPAVLCHTAVVADRSGQASLVSTRIVLQPLPHYPLPTIRNALTGSNALSSASALLTNPLVIILDYFLDVRYV